MKSKISFLLLYLLLLSCSEIKHPNDLSQLIEEGLKFSLEQYKLMAQSLPDSTRFPRTTDPDDGSLITSRTDWWCSGFFPGSLWYLYEYSGDSNILEEAQKRTAALEKEKFNKGTHDLGFMLYNSYGNGYRLMGDPQYRDILITGAQSLASRYNDTVGCIRSWDHGSWKFPVIIDNMMNLEYLFWATKVTGDSTYYNMAVSHTEKTIQNHFRDDWSSYHLVDFDPLTGEVIGRQTVQGAFDESAWARGQAWGLYGFTVAYRETGNENYLEVAKGITDFILNHPDLPEDMIPYWDFNAPEIPDAKRDASSAAIISSALLELQKYVDGDLADIYLDAAEKIIRTLSSPSYRSAPGENNNFILMHGVGSLPGNSEVDVPLTYADYYYIESLIKFREILGIGEKGE
jgi:unsaturated chondroitin disaccharide hydrolase